MGSGTTQKWDACEVHSLCIPHDMLCVVWCGWRAFFDLLASGGQAAASIREHLQTSFNLKRVIFHEGFPLSFFRSIRIMLAQSPPPTAADCRSSLSAGTIFNLHHVLNDVLELALQCLVGRQVQKPFGVRFSWEFCLTLNLNGNIINSIPSN